MDGREWTDKRARICSVRRTMWWRTGGGGLEERERACAAQPPPQLWAHQSLLHTVWFIRDTSIRDMVEFPEQTKGHLVIETICSNTAKGQSIFKNPSLCTVSIKWHDKLADYTLWTSPYWSQLGCYSFFSVFNVPVLPSYNNHNVW